MDYKSFLKPVGVVDSMVLPYFGGTRIDAPARRFRVRLEATAALAPGWWRCQIDGRHAVPLEPALPVELAALPVLRGHYFHGFVIKDGELVRIALPPDDDPPALARVMVRRWYSGDWLFDTIDFEDDAELAARVALEELRPLGATRNVVPSLRTAFGYALGMAVARELGIPMSVHELAPIVVEIAEGGRAVVRELFAELVEQRRREVEAARIRAEAIAAAG
nr:hypothetical protein [Deltaproteobacteria bacterium]